MDIGMLWFDPDTSREVEKRIARAADFYHEKYGRSPNLCYVHPSLAKGALPRQVAQIQVRTSVSVLPDHFWLGVHDPSKEAQQVRAAA